MAGTLAGRTVFITGASRGIGEAIALRCAQDGANIVIAAKTAEPHPKLPGTVYWVAKEIESKGGKALPCIVDIQSEEQVKNAFDQAVDKFGGVDILVNNASAIHLTGTEITPMKRYDLMNNINTRGTFMCSKYAIPFLKKGTNPHILNISPPLNMTARWFKDHVAYTIAKYGMSMCALGMAEELKPDGVAVNTLWPRTGAFIPLTLEGNIVVEGVLASCYAKADHDLGHIGLALVRWFPEVMECIFGENNGLSIYANIVEDIDRWMQPYERCSSVEP